MTVSGTFTIDGTGTGGATVTVIDIDTSPPTVLGTTTTASDGTWSVDPGIDTTVECLLEYDDGSHQYKVRSKPYISHSAASTETIIDDFEDASPLSHYTGGTSPWSVDTATVSNGSQSLSTDHGGFSNNVITSDGTLDTPSIGDTITWDLWLPSNEAVGMHFCVQDSSDSNSYWVDVSNRDTRIRIGYWSSGNYNRLSMDDGFGPITDEWLTCEIATAQGSGEYTFDMTLTDSSGNTQSTISTSDTNETYASGAIGWSSYGDGANTRYVDYARYS